MPERIALTSSGEDSFGFNGQIAQKNTVSMRVSKNNGGSATVTGFIGEETQADSTVTVTGIKYRWHCNEAMPGAWVPASSMGGNPYYNYMVETPGSPGGSIEITIDWKPWTAPPEEEDLPAGESQTQWKAKKVVLDQGLWVQVEDTGSAGYGKLVSKFPDVIDLLISDADSAERYGQNIIWESVKKREGYIPAVFIPLLVPGDIIQTSHSQQRIYDWPVRVRRIVFNRSPGNQTCQYYIKERGIQGE
jgi:hypothetical protein